jgi:hypothetical protein
MLDITKLYSYQGQEPQPLPFEIFLNDGRSRTNSSTFTEEEIIEAGFIGPYERPEFNPDIETQQWDSELGDWVTTPIPDEVFWERLRGQRNYMLATSDWSQLTDAPLTSAEKSAWAAYRQELRDLPENTEDPKEVTWPLQPE